MDPRTPVIIGAAQVIARPSDGDDLGQRRGPIELMAEAARSAADDAGAPGALGRVGWLAVAGGVWSYRNPGRLIAPLIGAESSATALSSLSGDNPQRLVGMAADMVARGKTEMALVLGGEARWSMRRLKAAGLERPWIDDDAGIEPVEKIIGEIPQVMIDEGHALGRAPTAYALMESAIRARRGETHEQNRERISRLWAGFSAVAAQHPYAWDRTAYQPDEIATPSPDNRMIAWPYTKAMVANNQVDMASATLICSTGAADELDVATDRRVYLHACSLAHDTYALAERAHLDASSAIGPAAELALNRASIGMDDIAHLDLYSCFPSMVEISTQALGLSTERPLTLTGGLGFAGAPMANASGQAIAALIPRLRADEGSWGLIHANGGMATKHAIGVYSTRPPSQLFSLDDVQDRLDLGDRRAGPSDYEGPVRLIGVTVNHGRQGPEQLVAVGETPDGHRVFANSDDPALMEQAQTTELVGQSAHRQADGTVGL